MQQDPEPFWRLQGLAVACFASGRKKEADTALAELVRSFNGRATFQIAEVYAH